MSDTSVAKKRINVREFGFHPLSLRLWHGMTLDAWLRMMRGKWHLVSVRRYPLAATITLFSIGNLAMKGLTRLLYGRRVDAVVIEPDPIFVIGYWRSGTTWLHNLFMLDQRFAAPAQGDCFMPEFFLTTRKLIAPIVQRLLPQTRPMDNVNLDLSAAEEDEMGICLSGVVSPYASLLFPNEEPILVFRPETMSPKDAAMWRKKWLGFLRSVQFINPGKQLVLKSPTHSMRIAEVLRHFPNAKFVHIRRDPVRVFLSQREANKAMYSVSALQDTLPVDPNRDETLMDGFVKFHEYLEADIKTIPKDQFTTIRYEDLRQDTVSSMRNIYEALDLGDFSKVEPILKKRLETARPYKTNAFELEEATRDLMDQKFADIFKLYGYPLLSQRAADEK